MMNVCMAKTNQIQNTMYAFSAPWRTKHARLLNNQGDSLQPPGGRQDGQL